MNHSEYFFFTDSNINFMTGEGELGPPGAIAKPLPLDMTIRFVFKKHPRPVF